MKLNTLKHFLSVIAALTLFTTVSMAQTSEETENTKNKDTKATAVNAADSTTKSDDKTTETGSTEVVSDDVHIKTVAEEENNTSTDDDYVSNTFSNFDEAIVSNEKPIIVFPNPMITSATIRFYNPEKKAVTLDIYDNTGRVLVHIEDLYDNEYNIDKDVIPQGIYYAKIKKKSSDDDEDDDDDDTNMTIKSTNGSDVQVYTTKFVVN